MTSPSPGEPEDREFECFKDHGVCVSYPQQEYPECLRGLRKLVAFAENQSSVSSTYKGQYPANSTQLSVTIPPGDLTSSGLYKYLH